MENRYKEAIQRLRSVSSSSVGGPFISEIFPPDWSYTSGASIVKSALINEVESVNVNEEKSKPTIPTSEKVKQLDEIHDFSLRSVSQSLEQDQSLARKAISRFFSIASPSTQDQNLEELTLVEKKIYTKFRKRQLEFSKDEVKIFFITGETECLLEEELKAAEETSLFEFFFSSDCARLFERMLEAMKLKPENYIVSALKLNFENNSCDNHFEVAKDIVAYRPDIVITLGGEALSEVLGEDYKLQSTHGKFYKQELQLNKSEKHGFEVVPLFSPVFLHEAPNTKKIAWEDMQKVMKKLGL